MKYITIERTEDFERAKIILRSNLDKPLSFYYAMEEPATLMGSAKILSLRGKDNKNMDILAKVDGPGFIIEKLYEEFKR